MRSLLKLAESNTLRVLVDSIRLRIAVMLRLVYFFPHGNIYRPFSWKTRKPQRIRGICYGNKEHCTSVSVEARLWTYIMLHRHSCAEILITLWYFVSSCAEILITVILFNFCSFLWFLLWWDYGNVNPYIALFQHFFPRNSNVSGVSMFLVHLL